MRTQEYITKLAEELKQELVFRENPNRPGMAGVYYEGVYICAIPSGDIYEDIKPGYTITMNDREFVHPNMEQTKAKVESFINRWNNEEGFKELMTEKI